MATDQLCMRNSRGHNSFKNNSSATHRQYAQLGLVSIILVKLFWILTKGFWEIVFTRNVQTNGQNDRQTNKPTDNRDSYIAPIYYVSEGIINISQNKLEISLKVMNTPSWCLTIYICMRNSRGHNSFKNNSSATRWQYAQLGLVSIILVKLY